MKARVFWLVGILLAMGGVTAAGSVLGRHRGVYGSIAAITYALLFFLLLFISFDGRSKRKKP